MCPSNCLFIVNKNLVIQLMAEKIYENVDVAQLECQFKWFMELNNESGGQWLSGLLDKKLHNDLRSTIDVSEVNHSLEHETVENLHEEIVEVDDHPTIKCHRSEYLSWHCTLILRNTFEKNFAEAFQISKELLNSEEALNASQPKVHVDTFSYVMLANQLNILKEWRSSENCTVDKAEIVEISTRIESLKSTLESDEAKAFINAMKSNLSRDMQDSKLRVHFAKEVG